MTSSGGEKEKRHGLPEGTNLRILLQDCRCSLEILHSAENALTPLHEAIGWVGLTCLQETHHNFPEGGYTLALILAESHIVLHTWPEFNRLALIEASVCNYSRDNRDRTIALGLRLAELFSPRATVREITGMIPRLSEPLTLGKGNYVEIESVIDTRRSAYQDIMIAQSKGSGRCLILDGILQISEKDDYFYHEPLAQIAMLSHPQPKSVLICGGGDGGAAREVLKHVTVNSCTLVEIDSDVLALSKQYLKAIHQGALDDPRLKVVVEDAAQFAATASQIFDVILLDTADPEHTMDKIYSKSFLNRMRQKLAPGGLLALHVGAPLSDEAHSKSLCALIRSVFPKSLPYMQFVPCYDTLMAFMLCSNQDFSLLSLEELEERIRQRDLASLQIISPLTFHALFAIPPRFHRVLCSDQVTI